MLSIQNHYQLADLWKPEYKNSLLLTDDEKSSDGALRKLCYSGNTTGSGKEIEAAYEELKNWMPNVAAFNSDNPANPQVWKQVNPDGGTVRPRCSSGWHAGGRLPKRRRYFLDDSAIPANAKNKEGAAGG